MSCSFRLAELQQAIGGSIVTDSSQDITTLTSDSRAVSEGSLYVALRGLASDGHTYLADAFKKGAVAAVVEDMALLNGRPGIVVPSTRKAWSKLAAHWFHYPTKQLTTIGVTGTNGKTTVQWLLSQALQLLDHSVVRIGTLGVYENDTFVRETLTTPDAFDIQSALRNGLDHGADCAVLETSSHGLSQCRVDDVAFTCAIFTNLTRDHLDYHESFADYFRAKQNLFRLTAQAGGKGAVLNLDDVETAERLIALCSELDLDSLTYGFHPEADIHISRMDLALDGATIHIDRNGEQYAINTPCIGQHNASNLAAVWGALRVLGVEDNRIARILGEVKPAPGRLESVGTDRVGVYVDYAHTPAALENVLKALRPISQKKLWVVFGCGGDRDAGKRPLMGTVAGNFADNVIVTSDNPRTEDPEAIIADILASGIEPRFVSVDRKEAIHMALESAAEGDVVLIAGKGHEDYQILGTKKIHFSDQEVVRSFFESR